MNLQRASPRSQILPRKSPQVHIRVAEGLVVVTAVYALVHVLVQDALVLVLAVGAKYSDQNYLQ